ncbi:MAG: hypothetical protein A2X86_10055 [Bdellovibrionales bacterium GWA2_49_15]|nr:MAG: hypothetical protein A2X86_10055 [Bdellovibrionales bacterium GWA2_49_15]HAZ14240.1 hypothetical protein [Bdellovibrionales bacterium]
MRVMEKISLLVGVVLSALLWANDASAACGGTVRTWTSTTDVLWSTNGNWSNNNPPNTTTEDAVISGAGTEPTIDTYGSGTGISMGCLEIQSSRLNCTTQYNWFKITGDYFRNLNSGSMVCTTSHNNTIDMAGTAAQTFENYDPVPNLKISNNTTVTLTKPFTILKGLTFAAGLTAAVVNINANLTLDDATAVLTIPSGVTVNLNSGAILTAKGGLTVSGTLVVGPAGVIKIGNGKTLTVSAGATLKVDGANGNDGAITGVTGSDSYTFSVSGTLNFSHFRVEQVGAAGINFASGATVSKMEYGEFHYPLANSYAMTWGPVSSTLTLPATMNNLGFFNNNSASNALNIDATNYTGADVTFNDWAGDIGGESFDTDAGNKVDWGTEAPTALMVKELTPSGSPPLTLGQDSADTLFGTFSFSLTKTDTATDIRSVVVSQTGTAAIGDIEFVKVYRDQTGVENCVYNAGSDVLLGSGPLTGSPASLSVAIDAAAITVSSVTARCIHVVAATTAVSNRGKTIQFGIMSSVDVTQNSDGPEYGYSSSSAPPIKAGFSITTSANALNVWTGAGAGAASWSNTAHWWLGVLPSATIDCDIGAGKKNPTVDANMTCLNGRIFTGANMSWAAWTWDLKGSLEVSSTGVTLASATTATIQMSGAANQGVSFGTAWPGLFVVNNTGTAGNDNVTVNSNSVIQGNVTVTNGTLKIIDGVTLEVQGNITVQTGAVLEIRPNAILKMATGKTLTVDAGGTLKIVGESGKPVTITSNGATAAYNVVINGTIQARYYVFSYLDTTGVNIGTGATIDSTNHLQDGSFLYPVNNTTTLLTLQKQVPTNTLNNMIFDLNGSAATGTININTTNAAAGTLTLDNFFGNLGGLSYDVDPTYLLSWLGSTNTINLTRGGSGPATVNAGSTHNMGRFAFTQTNAGASFLDTDLTTLKLSLTGTGSANDVSAVKIYYDPNCVGSSGTLIGTGAYGGNPATVTFNISAGAAPVQADSTSPPVRCIYVEYVMALGAINANTVGVKIQSSSDVSNSEGYAIASGTAPPVDLGTAATIAGASLTSWTGATNTTWGTAGNWTAGVPTSAKTCEINAAANNPTIGSGVTATCKNAIIGTGTLTMTDGTSILEVYGSFQNTGTFTQGTGVLKIRDDGVTATDQNIESSSTLTSMTFNKTAGGTAVINTNMTITTLSIPGGSVFTFQIPSGKTLTLGNSLTINAGTFQIDGGATLKMPNSSTFQVDAGGTLKMVGSSSSNTAIMTSTAGGNSFNVVVNTGVINARYYTFDHLGTNGVDIKSTATIDGTNHLQDGIFTYPVSNSTTFLKLRQHVPTDTMANCKFDLNGSSATGTINIDTTDSTAGTLTLNGYTGDVSGPSFDTDPSYALSWTGATNTIDITQEATTAGTLNAGTTYNMGRFGFKQKQAGASYSNADLISLKLTLTGTAALTDIAQVRIYYDSACSGSAGTLIGTGVFSGSPGTKTFTISAGAATVQAHATTPPKRCIYVEYDLAGGATNNNTAGVSIAAGTHFSNDQGYLISSTTPAPITLGTAGTIAGALTTTWTGATDTDWATAGNWTGGVPDSTKNCIINDVANDPVIATASTGSCKKLTNNGVITLNAASSELDVYSDLENYGTITTNGGTLKITDAGVSTNHTITSSTALTTLTFDKTNGGIVQVGGTNLQITTLTIPASSSFEFKIANAKNLILANSLTVNGATLTIDPGGTLKMGTATTLTVATGATLKMIGTSGSYAVMNSTGATDKYNVVIDGTIQAQFYTFDHLNTGGVTINSGATINTTYHLQNGKYIYPVSNGTTLLTLKKVVPTDSMYGCHFDLNGSAATGTVNVDTTNIATVGTLVFDAYTGNLSGELLDNPGVNYVISWTGALNTINVTNEASSPGSGNAGSTYNMGRFGFTQTIADSAYVDTNITSLKLTLTGTGVAADVAQVRIYYDSACSGSGGTLLGSGTFGGSPASVTFSGLSGATVQKDATTPPKRCVYVQYDIASGATNNATVGVKINASGDMVNSASYTIAAGTPAPISLGSAMTIIGATSTTWTGTTSTAWNTAGNWTAGVPSSTVSCTINDATNDPVINAITANCKDMTIGTGIVTMTNATAAVLQVYGNYSNSGTLTQNDGTFRLVDASGSAQTVTSSSAITALTFTKTAGGSVTVNTSALTITTLTIPAGSNFNFIVPNGKTLTLTNGLTLPAATFDIQSGGTVKVGNTKTITVSGGTFKITGVAEAYPQTASTKGKITVDGAGTWDLVATSGNVYLEGFILDYMAPAGVQINGTTNLTQLRGGQFTNLSNTYASVKAIQLNTTGTVPVTAQWVGWNWTPNNTIPANTDAYKVISSATNGCGNSSIDFDGWFGDWFDDASISTFDAMTKVTQVACTITLSAARSPVSIASFSAVGYDGAVDLHWRTTFEVDHLGFNVYRSNSDGSEYQQINQRLLKNINNFGGAAGNYRFIDNNVVNGQTYYYYIEDVHVNMVTRKLHGPRIATPLAGFGAPAADDPADNSDSNDDLGDQSTADPSIIANPSFKDLGNGAVILSQTSTDLRLEINPPAPTFSAAAWNATYDEAAIIGYTKTQAVGHPELLERILFIEVYEGTTSAAVSDSSVVTAVIAGHKITPAPAWNDNGSGVLVSSYAENAGVYAQNSASPSTHFNVQTDMVSIGYKKYLRVVINPLRYNPVSRDLTYASKITIDIGLNGSTWSIGAPADADFTAHPSVFANNLRINYNQSGVYKLTYEDLVNSSVEAPFAGRPVSEFRLYHNGVQVPMMVESATGSFGPNDYVVFFAPYDRLIDDTKSEVILASSDLYDDSGAVRIGVVDCNPDGAGVSSQVEVLYTASAEQNLMALLNTPVADNHDHFYWKMIYAPGAAAAQYLDVSANLTKLNTASSTTVKVKVYVKGIPDATGDVQHHLGIYLNGAAPLKAQSYFWSNEPHVETFEIAANQFVVGANTIKVKVMGDTQPLGKYEIVYLDRVEVIYPGTFEAASNRATVANMPAYSIVKINGFTNSNIVVYDITSPAAFKEMVNPSITTSDSGVTYDVKFSTESYTPATNRNYLAMTAGGELKPVALSLTRGFERALKDTDNAADLIIIGTKDLLGAAEDLVAKRESDGLRVAQVELEQIYNEFSNGQVSSAAIRDFVTYALSNWTAPGPKYLLLLGDGTIDPRDILGYVPTRVKMPMALMLGTTYDFAADNWFVETSATSYIPTMAVGRIPTSDPAVLSDYIDKMLSYEEGTGVPDAGLKKMVFIADEDQIGGGNENFKVRTNSLIAADSLLSSEFTSTGVYREDMASNAATKAAIVDSFTQGPLLINYLGHGAENMWADELVFENADAESLTNEKLPIVMTLSCLNSHFFNPDIDDLFGETIGEKLIFNPDGGAIAFFGSTTMTTPPAQNKLAQMFYDELANRVKEPYQHIRIGDIALNTKVALGNDIYMKDMVRGFTLFGDPSMPLPEKLFPPVPVLVEKPKEQVAAPTPAKSKGFGCSANASEGSASDGVDGVLEFVTMLALIFVGRRVTRKFEKVT